jgi:hypothetical protein
MKLLENIFKNKKKTRSDDLDSHWILSQLLALMTRDKHRFTLMLSEFLYLYEMAKRSTEKRLELEEKVYKYNNPDYELKTTKPKEPEDYAVEYDFEGEIIKPDNNN